jgi:hypothetical protein
MYGHGGSGIEHLAEQYDGEEATATEAMPRRKGRASGGSGVWQQQRKTTDERAEAWSTRQSSMIEKSGEAHSEAAAKQGRVGVKAAEEDSDIGSKGGGIEHPAEQMMGNSGAALCGRGWVRSKSALPRRRKDPPGLLCCRTRRAPCPVPCSRPQP